MSEHTKTAFGLCLKYNVSCIDADEHGKCKSKKCRIVAQSNSHPQPLSSVNIVGITEPKRDDGIYLELFVVKDGVRHNIKIISLKELTLSLTNGLMDGFEKVMKD